MALKYKFNIRDDINLKEAKELGRKSGYFQGIIFLKITESREYLELWVRLWGF